MECACVIGLPEVKVSHISSYFFKKLSLACSLEKIRLLIVVIELVLWFGLGLY